MHREAQRALTPAAPLATEVRVRHMTWSLTLTSIPTRLLPAEGQSSVPGGCCSSISSEQSQLVGFWLWDRIRKGGLLCGNSEGFISTRATAGPRLQVEQGGWVSLAGAGRVSGSQGGSSQELQNPRWQSPPSVLSLRHNATGQDSLLLAHFPPRIRHEQKIGLS